MITPNIDDFYLLQDILNRNYYNDFKKGKKTIELLLQSNKLSLNSCSNCDIVESPLYPNQDIFTPTHSDKFTNLQTIVDWYLDNEFNCNIEFNGCIEDEEEISFLNALEQLIFKFNINKKNKFPRYIIFHTQMKNIEFIQKVHNLFDNNKIKPIFYIHINGYYCDNNIQEQYYDKIFEYTKNKPMFYYSVNIDSSNIKNWIQNYKWWVIHLGLENFLQQMYFNETLNDKWDYDNIQNYLEFLDFQIDFLSENLINFNQYIFNDISNDFNKPVTIQLLDQEILTNKKYYQNCLFHNGITIDLLTLKLPACCKLNYPIYHIGEFVYENNEIIIKPLNVSLLIPKAHLKRSSTPHCEYCHYLNICDKTCYGENFKISFNPLCPIKESCTLQQCKYDFLIHKYSKMDLFNLDDYNLDNTFQRDLTEIKKRITWRY